MWCGSGDRQARHITTFVLQVRAPRLTIPAMDGSSATRFAAEIALLAVLLFNVAQASYALKYPRVPPPPAPSPARKAKDTPLSPARQWRLSSSTTPNVRFCIEQLGLNLPWTSPQSSPQRQKAFSSYAPSPVSTPSRIVNYTIPGSVASPPDASFASSMSIPGSPASPLAAYRGRHSASV